MNITAIVKGDRITAKGGGKQRTVKADPDKSKDFNCGTAAGAVLLAHGHSDPSLADITMYRETPDGGIFKVMF